MSESSQGFAISLIHTSDVTVDPNERTERARRWIVNIVFIIYWLLIFEGALRKWVFPQYFQVLFFIRDPFVLIVYFLAWRNHMWPRLAIPLAIGIFLACVSSLLALLQLISTSGNLLITVYGLRNYFYYIPLAFIIGEQFRKEDLARLIRQTLLVAIPIAVLVYVQFSSPADAIINQGLIEGGLYQPGVVRGIVRTYGTFTSSAGQSPFIVSIVAMVLATWVLPNDRRPLKGVALLAATGAVLTNLAVSGSRAAFFYSIPVLLSAITSGLVLPQAKMRARAVSLSLILVIATALLIPIVFSTAFDAIIERTIDSYESESELYAFGTIGRPFYDMVRFIDLMPDTPMLGYGIGLFGNAYISSATLLLGYSKYAEDDWSRNIVELGPALGLSYIFFRIALVFWLARGAVQATRRSNNLLPLLLIGFIGIILLSGQITGHGSVNGYGWLFAGFCMAANQLGYANGERPSSQS